MTVLRYKRPEEGQDEACQIVEMADRGEIPVLEAVRRLKRIADDLDISARMLLVWGKEAWQYRSAEWWVRGRAVRLLIDYRKITDALDQAGDLS